MSKPLPVPSVPPGMHVPTKVVQFQPFGNGLWSFCEEMDESNSGFIYVIRDRYMGRFYLGKKSFKSIRGINAGKPMDWRRYKSSSKLIKEMLEIRPLSDFEFFCIEQYKSRGTLSYAETWSLCMVEAPTTDMWYNHLIEKVSWKV